MPMPKIHPHQKGGVYMNATFGGKRISIYGATEDEVEKKYIQRCYEYGLGVKVGQHVLMKDYMRTWLSIHKGGIKPYTYDGYKTNVEKHIIPALGDMYLQQLHPADIKSFYNQKRKERITIPAEKEKLIAAKALAKAARTPQERAEAAAAMAGVNVDLAKSRPLGETSLLYVHRVLHAALEEAVNNQMIPFNPADRVKQPKAAKFVRILPEEDGVKTLFASVRGTEYEIGVHLAVACGLRRGEICGLEWDAIDWENHKLLIDRAIIQTKETGRIIDLPKEDKIRALYIPDTLIEILRDARVKQMASADMLGSGYTVNNLIVKHNDGTPYTPTAMSSAICDAIRRAGLKTTLHGLRSTYVSIGYKLKVDEKAMAEASGHHSVEFNRAKYQTVYDSMKAEIADKMDAAFYENPSDTPDDQV